MTRRHRVRSRTLILAACSCLLLPALVHASRQAVKIDPALYDAYVGEYELAPGFILTVTREGDHLMTQATGQSKVEVFPSSETDFFLTVVDAQITFVKGPAGAVDGLVLHQGGRDMTAKRRK